MLPALIIPENLGSSVGSEVYSPELDEAGKTINLVKSAKLSLLSGDACRIMPQIINWDQKSPSQIVYSCGDRVVFVKLKL